jgi:hypothetical protein
LKKILPFFSYLFHPLFIPLYAVLYYFLLDESYMVPAEKYLIVIQVIIITILIPISFFFLLRSLGKIDSVMVHDLGQRRAPLIMQAVLIYLLSQQSITLERIPELYFFFLSALITTVLALVCLLAKTKSSLHLSGMGGLLFFVIGLSLHSHVNILSTIAFLVLVTGFVASSRLYMKAHNYKELVIGFVSGMLPQMLLWFFWL